MGRPRGSTKTPGSGRKKGSKNKRTKELLMRAQEFGIDPFDCLMHIVNGDWKALGYDSPTKVVETENGVFHTDIIELKDRLIAAKEACSYLYPKKRAVEVTPGEGTAQTLVEVIKASIGKK